MKTTPGVRCLKNGWEPVAGLLDFDGACLNWESGNSVSVAVFCWINKSKHGLKRGKSLKRFSGSPSEKEAIFAKAEAYCRQLEMTADHAAKSDLP